MQKIRVKLAAKGLFSGLLAFSLLAHAGWAFGAETSPGADAGSGTVTIVYEPRHNPPRALGRGTRIDWKKPGLTLELLKMVGQDLGIDFRFKRMPWKRGLYLLERNEIDGIFHASYKPDREKIGVYPKSNGQADEARSIFHQSYVLYTKRSSAVSIDNGVIAGVDGYIGAITGYSIAAKLRKQGFKVDEANSLAENFDNLVADNISAFAMLENMGDDYLVRNSDKYTDIIKVSPALVSKPYYLMLSHQFVRDNPELAEQIWDAIAGISASDPFKALESTY